MGQRNRKLVTYGRSATSQTATNAPRRQGESDTASSKNRNRSSIPAQRQWSGYAGDSGPSVTGARDGSLVNRSLVDTSVYDPLSSSDEGKAYTPIQNKRRKRVSEAQGQQSHRHSAYASQPSMISRPAANREYVSAESDSTKASAAADTASQQRRDQGKHHWELLQKNNQHGHARSIPREELDDRNTRQIPHKSFDPTLFSGSVLSSSKSPSQSSSDTRSALGDVASNRKRLVDRLATSEQSARGLSASSSTATGDEFTASYSVRSSLADIDASKGELARINSPGTGVDDSRNSQETAAPRPSHLRSSTVTYARQRSFLTDDSVTSEIGSQDVSLPSTAVHHQGKSQTATESGSFSLPDEDDGYNGTGPVRSIHELRRAGENARFRASVESIFEDIEDTFNSTTRRCNGFIQLCGKLSETRTARCFVECGFDKRLLEDITSHLDVVSATLALSGYEMISSCGPLSSTLIVPFWSKILDLSPRLLEAEEDILLLAKRRHYGISETVQAAIQDILPQLAFALSKNQPSLQVPPLQLSPRLLALRCIRCTITSLREKGDTTHSMPLSLLNWLVDFLLSGSRNGPQKCSVGCFQVLALSFSILESYTLLSGPLESDYEDAIRPLSRLHDFLFPKGDHDNRSSQIPVLYMRVILNITNSNPRLCTDFATPELVEGLVRKVVAGFCGLAKDSPARENNFLEAVVLALGTLTNLAEDSKSSRLIMISKPVGNSETLFRTLLNLFVSNTGSTSEAHSVLEVKHNVAIGYLSILLAILCLDAGARREVRQSLDGNGLAVILSTVDEFLQYHQKVDLGLRPSEAAGGQMTAFMTKLQDIVGQVRHSEME